MKHFILLLACCILLVNCKKGPEGPKGETGAPGNNGPSGTAATGTISGNVYQYDEFSKRVQTSLNTITVSVEGTTLSTVTNEKGIYTLADVPAGTYTLNYKGPKTQVMKNTQVSLVGNGILYVHASIVDKPTWLISNPTLTINANQPIYGLTGTITNTLNFPKSPLLLFSLSTDIDNQDPSTYDYARFINLNSNQSFYSSGSPQYPEGTIFYAKVYAAVPGFSYTEVSSQRVVNYSVGDVSSPVFTLTMPKIN